MVDYKNPENIMETESSDDAVLMETKTGKELIKNLKAATMRHFGHISR